MIQGYLVICYRGGGHRGQVARVSFTQVGPWCDWRGSGMGSGVRRDWGRIGSRESVVRQFGPGIPQRERGWVHDRTDYLIKHSSS